MAHFAQFGLQDCLLEGVADSLGRDNLFEMTGRGLIKANVAAGVLLDLGLLCLERQ